MIHLYHFVGTRFEWEPSSFAVRDRSIRSGLHLRSTSRTLAIDAARATRDALPMRISGVLVVLAILGCSNVASLVSGSCTGNQSLAGMTVQLCTESPSETLDQQATLNTLCQSGQLGSAASLWQQGVSCTTTARVGGCQRTVNGIDVVSWVYPGSTMVNATSVRAFCTSIQASYVNP